MVVGVMTDRKNILLLFILLFPLGCSGLIHRMEVATNKLIPDPSSERYPYLTEHNVKGGGYEVVSLISPKDKYEFLSPIVSYSVERRMYRIQNQDYFIYLDQKGQQKDRLDLSLAKDTSFKRLKHHKEVNESRMRYYDYRSKDAIVYLENYSPRIISQERIGYNGTQGTWDGTIGKGFFRVGLREQAIRFQFDHVRKIDSAQGNYYDTMLDVYTNPRDGQDFSVIIIAIPGQRYYQKWMEVDYFAEMDERGSLFVVRKVVLGGE